MIVLDREERKEAGKISEQEYLSYLIDTYQNLVFSICYRMTGNYFDSEDLSQDTFLSAYRKFSDFDGQNEKAWLCRIATNKCLDYLKRSSRKQILTEDSYFADIAAVESTTEEKCLEEMERQKLLENCKSLKPPYSEVAREYFYEEKTPVQIAEKLSRNEKTVQTQIYRAKAMLRKLYERM